MWAMSQDPSHSGKKANTGKYNLRKLKRFFTASDAIKRRHSAEWEPVWASYTYDRGLISRIHKKLDIKKSNNLINKWASETSRLFLKDKI